MVNVHISNNVNKSLKMPTHSELICHLATLSRYKSDENVYPSVGPHTIHNNSCVRISHQITLVRALHVYEPKCMAK